MGDKTMKDTDDMRAANMHADVKMKLVVLRK
jgi:hypothetical protein